MGAHVGVLTSAEKANAFAVGILIGALRPAHNLVKGAGPLAMQRLISRRPPAACAEHVPAESAGPEGSVAKLRA